MATFDNYKRPSMSRSTKKPTAKKLKTTKMYAAMFTCYDREDIEDSYVEIIGVYNDKKTAKKYLDEHKKKRLAEVVDDPEEAEQMLGDDEDRIYDWSVKLVKVEV